MGMSTSTHAKAASASTDSSIMEGKDGKQQIGVSGRTYNKSANDTNQNCVKDFDMNDERIEGWKNVEADINDDIAAGDIFTDDESYVSDDDSDDDSDDEEEDDEEVQKILEDAKKLKILAEAFLHPEKKITSDATSFARNYFNTPSVHEAVTETIEEAEERALILQDVANLKLHAVQYMHPEIPVTQTNEEKMMTCTRNYFSSYGAHVPQQSREEAEEQARIIEDAQKLKNLATDYMHPEIGIQNESTDPTAFGRNYYGRPSTVNEGTDDEVQERERILLDMKALKQAARDYLHPEVGVTSSDPTSFARNYFDRHSAPETEDIEIANERARVLAEAKQLKKLATDYMHPEVGVTSSDPTSFARNYFNRHSAPETEDIEIANERARVLDEAKQLKKLATDYMHPEVGVTSSDPTSFGRNAFGPDRNVIVTEAVVDMGGENYAKDTEEMSHDHMFEWDEHEHEYDFTEIRNAFASFVPIDTPIMDKNKEQAGKDDDEGNLSRSPSSVMLFGLESSA